jgi:uncharacterized tellurite resistance protein B-like protein
LSAPAAPAGRAYDRDMLAELSRDERLRLMKFVCSFAWADLEVRESERAFVARMIDRLGLDEDRAQVEAWLRVPPRPEDIDPTQIPRAHRELFLRAVKGVISADHHIDPAEQENLTLLEQLLV